MYKRQDHDCWKTGFQAAADKDGSIVEFRGISGVATEDTRDLDGAEPVSYTHLDVYKRQPRRYRILSSRHTPR